MLWQVGILKVSHDRYIAIKVAKDVIVAGAQHLQFRYEFGLGITRHSNHTILDLREQTVAGVDAFERTLPTLQHTIVFGCPYVLVPTLIDVAIDPTDTQASWNNILIGTKFLRTYNAVPKQHGLTPGYIGSIDQIADVSIVSWTILLRHHL